MSEDRRAGELNQERLVDLDESEIHNHRSTSIMVEKDNSSLSPVRVQISASIPLTDEALRGHQAADDLQKPQTARAAFMRHSNNLAQEGSFNFTGSTDEDGDSERQEAGGESGKQPKVEENILRKRSRSPERGFAQTSGKKIKGNSENDMFPRASTDEGVERYPHHVVKVPEHRRKADWIEPPGLTMLLQPGLEKLHRVFTSLNTACGFLQKQNLETTWQNVKEALQQLSGADGEVLQLDDIQRLANLCPRMVVLSKVDGDDTSKIELPDPEAKTSEQLDMSTGTVRADVDGQCASDVTPVTRHISETEARLLVERRQKAFQVSLVQLAHQLQVPQGNSDITEHIMRRRQSNDGYHTMGPAILALPTQNLVLTPPPALSQQMQPGFVNISSGYNSMAFPLQAQSTNSYTPFGYPLQQSNNYVGYHISSIPSTSQPCPLPPQNVPHHAQTTSSPVVDLTEPSMTPEQSPFYHAQSMNKAKRRRSRNWDTWEVVLLVQAKKTEWERSEISSGRDRFESSGERWKKVEMFLKENKVIERDAVACKNKWESLLSDYKAIKDWNRKPGNPLYSSLTPADKKAANLPAVFASSLLDLMDTFQGKSSQVSPPSVVDSLARNAPAVSGGEGSGAEESAEALSPHGAEAVHGSVGKGKRSQGGWSPLVAAFDRMTANMTNIEKGRDERSERLLALETRKYELERNKFELLARKLEIEREDRKGLVRVLGNLAGAFHRMADKM